MTKAAESIEIALPDEVPPGWHRTTLGEIGEYINGRGFKKSEWAEQGLPIIRIQNLTGSGKEQNYYDGEIDERHVVNPGDLLISWAATLGAYLWAGPRAALNQHIFKVRSFVDKKFHYYLMQHILGDLYRQTHGSGMVHITKSKFDSMPIVVPETADQQKRIVTEIEKQFSRLDEAVANLKRVKANLKRYKAAVLKAAVEGRLVETEAELARREGRSYETGEQLLQRILETRRSHWKGKGKYKEPATPDTTDLPELPEGWVWATYSQVAEVTTGFTPPTADTENFGGDIPFFKPTDLDAADNVVVAREHLSRKGAAKGRLLPAGSVLVTCIGATIGKTGLARVNCATNQQINAVTPHGRFVDSAYVYSWTVSPFGYKQILDNASATTLPILNKSKFESLVIPIPAEAEQHLIVAEVDRRLSLLRETEAQVDANLQRAERLRQSILSRAFSGCLS